MSGARPSPRKARTTASARRVRAEGITQTNVFGNSSNAVFDHPIDLHYGVASCTSALPKLAVEVFQIDHDDRESRGAR